MEKMNQVSVSEFMTLTKTQMYDKAVEMVEKYNRLVDICNDSSERMADLVIERDDLKEEIEKRKKAFNSLQQEMATRYITIETHNGICKDYEDSIDDLKEEIEGHRKVFNNIKKSNLATQEENEKLKKELEEYKDLKTNNAKRRTEIIELRDKIAELKKQNEYLTKELEQTYKDKETDLKNHNKRDMTLVDELAKKNDKIKDLKGTIEYYKAQEHIRTDQLRATESKVDDLVNALADKNEEIKKWKNKFEESRKETIDGNAKILCLEVNLKRWKDIAEHNMNDTYKKEIARLEKEIKQKQDIIKTAYERYSNEVIKTRKDLMEVAYRDIEKDNGYVGFKLYVKNTLTEAKGDKKEANEIITDAVKTVYAEWSKEEKEKDDTEVKGNGRTSSGRYPWGTKVNDIPCGEDSIE